MEFDPVLSGPMTLFRDRSALLRAKASDKISVRLLEGSVGHSVRSLTLALTLALPAPTDWLRFCGAARLGFVSAFTRPRWATLPCAEVSGGFHLRALALGEQMTMADAKDLRLAYKKLLTRSLPNASQHRWTSGNQYKPCGKGGLTGLRPS